MQYMIGCLEVGLITAFQMRVLHVSFIMVYAVYACTDEYISHMSAPQQKHCKIICESCECEKAKRCASGAEARGCRNRPMAAWEGCQSMCKGCLGIEHEQATAVAHERYVPEIPVDRFTCDKVRGVSADVRSEFKVSSFFSKYTEAYGIPIFSSNRVPNQTLSRVCYVTRFLLTRRDMREVYVERKGYVIVVADDEDVYDIPEYANMRSDYTTPEPEFPFMKEFKAPQKFKYGGERGHFIGKYRYPITMIGEETATCRKFMFRNFFSHIYVTGNCSFDASRAETAAFTSNTKEEESTSYL